MEHIQKENFIFYLETLKNMKSLESFPVGVVLSDQEDREEIKKISSDCGYVYLDVNGLEVGQEQIDQALSLDQGVFLDAGESQNGEKIFERIEANLVKLPKEVRRRAVVVSLSGSQFDALSMQDLVTSVFRFNG